MSNLHRQIWILPHQDPCVFCCNVNCSNSWPCIIGWWPAIVPLFFQFLLCRLIKKFFFLGFSRFIFFYWLDVSFVYLLCIGVPLSLFEWYFILQKIYLIIWQSCILLWNRVHSLRLIYLSKCPDHSRKPESQIANKCKDWSSQSRVRRMLPVGFQTYVLRYNRIDVNGDFGEFGDLLCAWVGVMYWLLWISSYLCSLQSNIIFYYPHEVKALALYHISKLGWWGWLFGFKTTHSIHLADWVCKSKVKLKNSNDM